MNYVPKPMDTSHIKLPPHLEDMIEKLAANVHENWALLRVAEGWKFGAERNDQRKQHPCLIPYDQLPETEKHYDRQTVLATIKTLIALGCRIEKDE
jgi:ryanodine receptor 2